MMQAEEAGALEALLAAPQSPAQAAPTAKPVEPTKLGASLSLEAVEGHLDPPTHVDGVAAEPAQLLTSRDSGADTAETTLELLPLGWA